ncbi:Bicupin oxalate decarboxylase/oxidase [Ceraceosorus guamensis]|uniref:Bicupin oxalate decarboxylase/oxidase n=1 Tax=Ceraceosorus guamensis TaxID=1522189 RepID=A0A316W2F1_9BASI|nr:Bicupin oxalate decarboxylase/oxidase [Ceraceosorus guamensis]PWN43932.1 Bicupin oxalate decarboxylase/oxidase [Ceraceosorus guamensis]
MQEHEVPLPRSEAAKSVLHNRVARHIRPETWSDIRRRQTLGPVTDLGGITDFKGKDPEPVRGEKGLPFLGESNTAIDKQNIDYLSPPATDNGVIPNLKWSFSLSKTRLLKGGWVREQVVTDLPVSKDVAAAEQRLAPYAIRQLHWHRVAEWAFVIKGTVRITGSDEDGKNYVGEASAGDLWSFPTGIPHSLQAGPEGAQYLLVFDDGNFDASGTTFMLDDWVAHTPRDVLAENFGWNQSAFDTVPAQDQYIFKTPEWPSLEEAKAVVEQNPAGEVESPYVYALSKQEPTQAPGGGGWVKITDYRQFPASPTLASAYVHVEKGGLRELHWHAGAEWGYIVKGKGRATAFAGGATARTFELQAGDSWVFPTNFGHYIQNVGDEPLEFIEIFRGSNFGDKIKFTDFSLTQWLSLTPPEVAAQSLNVSVSLIKELKKEKQVVVAARR